MFKTKDQGWRGELASIFLTLAGAAVAVTAVMMTVFPGGTRLL